MARTLVGAVVVAVVVTAGVSALAQQRRDTAPPPQASGRISGTVIGAESQRPVRFARVEIGSSAGGSTTVTDDNGAFTFERLMPGAYMLHVSKPGYLDTQYGQNVGNAMNAAVVDLFAGKGTPAGIVSATSEAAAKG